MDENRLLRRLARGDSEALPPLIEAYSAYVYTIVKNIVQPPLPDEDVEEVVSDVFLTLWERAADVEQGRLRPWLAAVTRNKARDKLRALRLADPLGEDYLLLSVPGPEEDLLARELRQLTRRAVESLPEPDRSIFQRHYYLYQKTDEIAAALELKPATVRTRLSRGREKLKQMLAEGGFPVEADHC